MARVGLHRPEVKNAIHQGMVDEMIDLLAPLAQDPNVRALVLIGEGGLVFASGADIAELQARKSPQALQAINARMFQAVEDFPKPTIAAIEGYALGGGLELALACDLRVCGEKAKLGLPEVTLGIYPAAGGTWRLPRLIGLGRAKDLVFTGRLVQGPEALAMGLVERCVADGAVEAEAMALARQIARNAPLALQVAKVSFHAAARGGDPTTAERLGQALLFDSEEKRARMQAFLDKRSKKS